MRVWMSRTRAVAFCASALSPKPMSPSTRTVRCRRAYGSSRAPVWAKKPVDATGCAACINNVRGPDSATTDSRWTRRIIDSFVKKLLRDMLWSRRYVPLPFGDHACRRLLREGVRLPVQARGLRPDLRARHAGDALLHRLPEALRAQVPRRRRWRDRPGEGRGAAGLRRQRGRPGAPDRARARGAGRGG